VAGEVVDELDRALTGRLGRERFRSLRAGLREVMDLEGA
jgi:hypothetical protein